jgi:alginate O-acetyltransferase complex protein AlgI
MNFNSLEFLVVFLPVTFFSFYAVPVQLRLWVLVVASLIFYGVTGLEVLLAFLVAIFWGYGTAFLFGKIPKRLALVVAIIVPGLTLLMFKYLNFILDSVHAGPHVRDHFWFFLSIVLPAGISFYTFEIVSYSIDVADKKIKADRDLLRFTSFATFFPHLIAGPIMRYVDLQQQLRALQTLQILKPNIVSGLKMLSIGLFFKIFVADISATRIAKAADVPLDGLTAVDQLTQIGFWAAQIYYDFWAYSVMAIGVGRLFCIELPVNFREPYLARNPREFWQRWHITLSYWLRDYVYIRMGGREFYVRNILIVFALVGLWHGAGWNFVAWGIYHAVLVIGYHFLAPGWDRLPKSIAIAMNFTLVSFGWPLFFLSLEKYAAFLRHFVIAPWHATIYGPYDWLYLVAIGFVIFGLREENWLYNPPSHRNLVTDSPMVLAILMFSGLLFNSLSRTFIYFRF